MPKKNKSSNAYGIVLGILLTIILFLAISIVMSLCKGYQRKMYVTSADFDTNLNRGHYYTVNNDVHHYMVRLEEKPETYGKYIAISDYIDDAMVYYAYQYAGNESKSNYYAEKMSKDRSNMKELTSAADEIDNIIKTYLE